MEQSLEKQNRLSHPAMRIAVALFCCFMWGCAFPCIKTGYRLLQIGSENTASLLLFAGYRFSLGGLLTILIYSLIGKRFLLPKAKELPSVTALGTVQTAVQYCLYYIGLSQMTGMKSSVFSGSLSFFVMLLACFVFRQERATKRKLLSCVLGFSGVLLVNMSGLDLIFRFSAEGIFLISVILAGFGNCMTKNMSKSIHPPTLNGYQMMIGGLLLTAAGTLMGGKLIFDSAGSILILLALALIAAVAQTLWTILIKHNEVSTISIFTFMVPVFGVLLSSLFVPGESVSISIVFALILISVGIIISNVPGHESKTK